MPKLLSNITGISEGLKNTEARDVKFIKSDTREIDTLHLAWDQGPKPEVHEGAYLLATSLGAPDPVLFEESLLAWFYGRTAIPGRDERPIPNARFVYSISLEDDERLKALFPAVRSAIRRYDANLGGFEDSMMGVENTFRNMERILEAPDVSEGRATYKGALLLSAGPSLDQEWKAIKEAKDSNQFFIIACDAVAKKAVEKGVHPDLIVTTERVKGGEDFLEGFNPSDLEKMRLCATLMAYPPALERWKGRFCFVVRKDYPSEWYPFRRRRSIWSAPSVAPTCLGILGLLGIQEVALVGQDLCLAKDGRSHTTLSPALEKTQKEMEAAEKARAEIDREEVETYSGEKRKTTNAWNVMRGDLRRVKDQWKQRVVSTSFHGAKIVGVSYQSLSEWLDERKDYRTGRFLLYEENPDALFERTGVKNKREEAKSFLKSLEDHLEDYSPSDLIELPHFREFCLTSLQRAYVTYLNKVFQNRGDRHEFKTLVRAEALSAIRDVLRILEIGA